MYQFQTLLISFITCTLVNSASSHQERPYETEYASFVFLESLIQKRFDSCKLVLLQDHHDTSKGLENFIVNSKLSYYNVKFTDPIEQEPRNVSNFKNSTIASENSSSTVKAKNNLPIKFPDSIKSHNKRSGQCFVLILLINDLQPVFMDQLSHMLTPTYQPTFRKDEDFFIFITRSNNLNQLLLMKEFPARIKHKLAIGESENGKLEIKSVCFFCNSGFPTIVDFPLSENTEYFPDFVRNLNGKVLKVTVPSMTSRIQVDPNNNGLKNAARGIWKNLFEDYLGVKFNFSYTMFLASGRTEHDRGGTGFLLENGTWIGVVGDIYYGKADIGILASKTLKRIHYMDTSDTFFDVGFLTFVASEGKRIFTPAALFWPFDNLMWTLITLSTILSFCIFRVLTNSVKWLHMDGGKNLSFTHRGKECKEAWRLTHQIQFIITSFLDQDCVMPTFFLIRCFVVFWLFFTLVITAAYRSKLVTLMAFPIIEEPPTTFEELAFSDYTVGFLKSGDSAYNTLKSSQDPIYVKLIAEMEVISENRLQCIQKVVQSHKYACIAYDFSIKYFRESNLSDSESRKLVYAPDHTYNIWTGLNFEGRSIYKKNFDKYLGLTRPMHFQEIWEKNDFYYNVRMGKMNWWKEANIQKVEGVAKDENESAALSVKHVIGGFWALGVGIIIGLISFVSELIRSSNWSTVLNIGVELMSMISSIFSKAIKYKKKKT